MTFPRPRWSIRGLMAMIAAVALILAVFSPRLAIGMALILTGFGALIVGVSKRWGVSRLRAAAWVTVAYPWFFVAALHATWIVARIVLGHPPRMMLDDPKYIGEAVGLCFDMAAILLLGFPAALFGCFCAVAEELIRWNRVRLAGLTLIQILSWAGAFCMLGIDNGRAIGWFLD